MPIMFGCPSCGKTLRVGDAHAGKSVRCPHCKGVATAPSAPPPAAAPPPATLSFDDEEDLPVAPVVSPPRTASGQPGRKPAGGGKPERDRPVRRPRPEREDEDYVDRGPGPRKWRDLGAGCGLVRVGLWIELGAVAVLTLGFTLVYILGETGLAFSSPKPPPRVLVVLAMLAYFIPLLIGAGFVAAGRMKIAASSSGTGAGGIMGMSAVLAVIRGLCFLGALGFLIPSVLSTTITSFGIGFVLLLIGYFVGMIVDYSVPTGMAVLGGVIPSDRLRREAGVIGMVLMIASLVWLVLSFVGGLASVFESQNASATVRPPAGGTTRSNRLPFGVAVMVAFTIVVAAFQCGYTYLQARMYSAGQAAGQGAAWETEDEFD